MNGDFFRYRGLLTVAVGAGVMIGAASVFIYNQLFGERRRLLLQQDISRLGLSIAEIRRELDVLRLHRNAEESGSEAERRRRRRQSSFEPDVSSVADDMYSAAGGDDADDDFYELSSDQGTNMEEENIDMDKRYYEIDALLEGISQEDKTKGYGLLLELLEKEAENVEVLWRLAKACHALGTFYGAEGDQEKRKQFIHKGTEYGRAAVAAAGTADWRAHKWAAACVGVRGQLPSASTRDKIADGAEFKRQVDAAIALNPDDPTLQHMLARFCYEVASLTWIERKVASTLFGGEVPKGTYDEAAAAAARAEQLYDAAEAGCGWKENRLLLAKCEIARREYGAALAALDSAKQVPAVSAEDQLLDKEIDTLLKKYVSYRGLQT